MGLAHLARRFFSFGLARPLTETERSHAATLLDEVALRDLFFDQPVEDQRHGYDAGRWLLERDCDLWMVQAGMLHDIGKRHARLGRWRRAIATVLRVSGMIPKGRLSLYNAHGPIGSKELAAAGADVRVVAYTAYHHGDRCDDLTADEWARLDEADKKN